MMGSDLRYYGSWVCLDICPPETTPLCQRTLRRYPFSFYLKHYVNQASQISAALGGVLTLGGTNSNLYKGSIEYLNLAGPPSHWLLAVSSVTVQGKTIIIYPPSGLAAIDTGTTLIRAPTPIAASIWAQVPDFTELTGDWQGLYAFPCDTNTQFISLSAVPWI
ncbi:aspartic peptidase domain-containing protein [Suillus lakei]|nr:aspartic peptidase domain-containing protein [Suillus lakei]